MLGTLCPRTLNHNPRLRPRATVMRSTIRSLDLASETPEAPERDFGVRSRRVTSELCRDGIGNMMGSLNSMSV